MAKEMTYLDALYYFQEMLENDFIAFVRETKQAKLDEGRIKYGDTLMHLAKNLRKELFAEEGMSPEEIEGATGTTQTYGRAIRTTPGLDYGTSGNRSMSGYSNRGENKSAYKGMSGRGSSMRHDGYSGAEAQSMLQKMQKMADMTTNHDERETIMRMIESLKSDAEQE